MRFFTHDGESLAFELDEKAWRRLVKICIELFDFAVDELKSDGIACPVAMETVPPARGWTVRTGDDTASRRQK